LKKISALTQNERAVVMIESAGMKVGIVLIASRLVRRIRVDLAENDFVGRGQRLGMIRFGSQVDLIIPNRDSMKFLIHAGDKVKAGETIISAISETVQGT